MAQGCLSILSELPIQHVNVKDLDALVRDPSECTFFRFYVLLLLGGRSHGSDVTIQIPVCTRYAVR